jgi:hypothetical protein
MVSGYQIPGVNDCNKGKAEKRQAIRGQLQDSTEYGYASLNEGDNVLKNASLGDFVVVRTCTYTNLDSTV